MEQNVFTQIRSGYEFFSRVERCIADEILKNPKEVLNSSMAELSRKAGVSQGSINNFSKKFSSGGYAALKLRVAQCLSSQQENPFTNVDRSCGVKGAMALKINEMAAAFRSTLQINEEASLKRAVDRILQARKIEIYGIFQSGIVAKDFCYQLIQLGIPATFVEDTLMCAVSASMLDAQSLVIAISSSGRTKEIIDAVKIAQRNHVPVISLTADQFSPLAKMSNEALLSTSSDMSVSDRGYEIRMTQQLVLDTLCSYIRSMIDEDGSNHYYKLREIINSHSIQD